MLERKWTVQLLGTPGALQLRDHRTCREARRKTKGRRKETRQTGWFHRLLFHSYPPTRHGIARKGPLSKRKVVFHNGSVHFHVCWWECFWSQNQEPFPCVPRDNLQKRCQVFPKKIQITVDVLLVSKCQNTWQEMVAPCCTSPWGGLWPPESALKPVCLKCAHRHMGCLFKRGPPNMCRCPFR